MRSQRVVIVILCMLAFAGAAHAADLQAGWYVKLGLVDVRGWDGYQWGIVDWNFVGGLGTYGPFEVTSPDPVWARRMVSVPSSVSGVAPGTSVDLWGEPAIPIGFPVSEVVVCYDTNYDATRMRLELLMYRADVGFTMLWAENRSGLHQVWTNVLGPSQVIPLGYSPVFRVTVVPEPGPFLAIIWGMLCKSVSGRRWRR